jgi:hypothetical protein
MSSTINFEEWIEQNLPDDLGKLYALKTAVRETADMTAYSAVQIGEKMFVRGPVNTLMLSSTSARAAFIKRINLMDPN